MNKFKTFSLFLYIFLCIYNNFYCKILITGKYTAELSDQFGGYGFKNGDELELLNDYTFKSNFRGNGTYKIRHTLTGTKIDINFYNKYFRSYFYRPYFIGKPKIAIYRDLHSGFQKK